MGWIIRGVAVVGGSLAVFAIGLTLSGSSAISTLEEVLLYYRVAFYPVTLLLEFPLDWLLAKDDLALPNGWKDWGVLYLSFSLVEFQFLWRGAAGKTGPVDKIASVTFFGLVSLVWPLQAAYFILSPFSYMGPSVRTIDEEDDIAVRGGAAWHDAMFEERENLASDWFVLMRRMVLGIMLVAGIMLVMNWGMGPS